MTDACTDRYRELSKLLEHHQTALARANKAIEELSERVSMVESDITTRGLLESANRPRRDVQEVAVPSAAKTLEELVDDVTDERFEDETRFRMVVLQVLTEAALIGAREHHDKLAAEDLARDPIDRRGGGLWWKVRRP